ncbi:MAG TPA: hypothetical protein VFH39_00515 [Candidatus Saccharimonadales bacterium]|nr:hypothetical protein [Candidatus Saccharimonadales bacterium]
MSKPTHKQLINAELATRSFNHEAKEVIKDHNPADAVKDLVLSFHCECSDRNCEERVPLTLQQYEDIHRNRAHFVLAPGHEEPRVEKVKATSSSHTVVEKPALK